MAILVIVVLLIVGYVLYSRGTFGGRTDTVNVKVSAPASGGTSGGGTPPPTP